MNKRIDLRKIEPDLNEKLVDILDDRSEMDLSHYKSTYSVLIRRMVAIGSKSVVCRELNEIVRDKRTKYREINHDRNRVISDLKNKFVSALIDLDELISSHETNKDVEKARLCDTERIEMSFKCVDHSDRPASEVFSDALDALKNLEAEYDPKHSISMKYGQDIDSAITDLKRKDKAKKSFIEAMSDLDRMKALHNGYVKGATIMVSLNGIEPIDNDDPPRSIVEVQTNGNEYDVLGADKDGSRFLIAIHNKERTYEYYSIVNTDGESIKVMVTGSRAPVELTWNSLFFGLLSLR